MITQIYDVISKTAELVSLVKYGVVVYRPQVPPKEEKEREKPVFRRHQDKDDIIMSSDLQEQLAELDKCIAELTTSMDIPGTFLLY